MLLSTPIGSCAYVDQAPNYVNLVISITVLNLSDVTSVHFTQHQLSVLDRCIPEFLVCTSVLISSLE